ncbi:MAG: T9SS type A sorting domain-containing protein [Candidatus Marinimicrobia bacterium]|nr:T9SS type A sorting domain-containing protein [Candidatus Neomarinimicrobiota bacterium]MBT4946511.1 T9SS type A sorting domain-containing protein [Candidatus Neomarinimicrobiota bacterium]MBT5269217.1 T9SS type A sorting domain-containing protein [Candidatus Neomarinimicrobiota bacterium]MBT6010459.1 T9SS type A sorting domain-containing protein [Candidatus Neomarinimicrobiota bacterium]MBT6758183.1 T9SS type A sorting domain-containing protein [Candidatus Neomarinimicrobiota bacterium]
MEAAQASVYSNSVTAYGDGGIGIPKGISNVELPEEFAMSNPFPNPFNSQLNYILGIPEPAEVIVQLYNINGRIVGEKAIPQIQAGVHQLAWNFSSSDKLVLSSGIYFFSCTINPLEGKRKPFKAIMKSTFVR